MNESELRKVFRTGCRVVQAPGPARRKRQIVSSMIVVLLLGANAHAQSQIQAQVQTGSQTGDWQVVLALKRGTVISVKAQHQRYRRYLCSVEDRTDDQLVCRIHDNRIFRLPPTMTFSRAELDEIRLEHKQANGGWIGAGMGAGVGAAAGASTHSTSRGFNAFIGALGGALVGGIIGTAVAIFHHGKVIYKR